MKEGEKEMKEGEKEIKEGEKGMKEGESVKWKYKKDEKYRE